MDVYWIWASWVTFNVKQPGVVIDLTQGLFRIAENMAMQCYAVHMKGVCLQRSSTPRVRNSLHVLHGP